MPGCMAQRISRRGAVQLILALPPVPPAPAFHGNEPGDSPTNGGLPPPAAQSPAGVTLSFGPRCCGSDRPQQERRRQQRRAPHHRQGVNHDLDSVHVRPRCHQGVSSNSVPSAGWLSLRNRLLRLVPIAFRQLFVCANTPIAILDTDEGAQNIIDHRLGFTRFHCVRHAVALLPETRADQDRARPCGYA